jgi:hypothetical protein
VEDVDWLEFTKLSLLEGEAWCPLTWIENRSPTALHMASTSADLRDTDETTRRYAGFVWQHIRVSGDEATRHVTK